MSAKYAVGDTVEFCGSKAKVIAVNEHHYFYSGDSAYYMYDLQYEAGGFIAEVAEPALLLISKGNGAKLAKRYCECGAWSVHWASEHHAPYCPEHRMFERKDE